MRVTQLTYASDEAHTYTDDQTTELTYAHKGLHSLKRAFWSLWKGLKMELGRGSHRELRAVLHKGQVKREIEGMQECRKATSLRTIKPLFL